MNASFSVFFSHIFLNFIFSSLKTYLGMIVLLWYISGKMSLTKHFRKSSNVPPDLTQVVIHKIVTRSCNDSKVSILVTIFFVYCYGLIKNICISQAENISYSNAAICFLSDYCVTHKTIEWTYSRDLIFSKHGLWEPHNRISSGFK
jgi:hypothetical protein